MIGFAIMVATAAASQAELDRFAIECGLEAGDVTLGRDRKFIRILPKKSQSPAYGQVLCLLPKLSNGGFRYKVGFISEPPASIENR